MSRRKRFVPRDQPGDHQHIMGPGEPEEALEGNVRINLYINRGVASKLDKLAADLGWSRNQTVEWVLDSATHDLEWVIKSWAAKFRETSVSRSKGGGAKGDSK